MCALRTPFERKGPLKVVEWQISGKGDLIDAGDPLSCAREIASLPSSGTDRLERWASGGLPVMAALKGGKSEILLRISWDIMQSLSH